MTIKTKYDIGQILFIARYSYYNVTCDECSGAGRITITDGNKRKVSLTCGKCGGAKNVSKKVLIPLKTKVSEITIPEDYNKNKHLCYVGYFDEPHFGFFFHGQIYYHLENYVATDKSDIIQHCDRQNAFDTMGFINVNQGKEILVIHK